LKLNNNGVRVDWVQQALVKFSYQEGNELLVFVQVALALADIRRLAFQGLFSMELVITA
jgi:hypothetical protein